MFDELLQLGQLRGDLKRRRRCKSRNRVRLKLPSKRKLLQSQKLNGPSGYLSGFITKRIGDSGPACASYTRKLCGGNKSALHVKDSEVVVTFLERRWWSRSKER